MDRDIDWVLLERWIAGECTPEQGAEVTRWIAGDPSRERLVAVLRTAWERAGAMPARRDAGAAWSALADRLHAETPRGAPARSRPVLRLLPTRRRPATLAAVLRIAAAVLLVAGGATFWQLAERSRAARTAAVQLQELTTVNGQRATITLSDGTRVRLGVASRIRFASTFTNTRDVYLEGQAFFEVAHDPTRPFTVHTARSSARALGTKFEVRAYGDAPDATVLVTEGSVALKHPTEAADSLILRPADLGRVQADGRLTVAHGVDVDSYLAWTRGQLAFDQTPLPEAVAQLKRWYNVDLRIGDPALARFALTTSLGTQPFPEAIRIVAAALDARVVRRDSAYVLLTKRLAR